MILASEIVNNLLNILPAILYLSFAFTALIIVNESKYSLKTTLIIVIPFLIILAGLNLTLYAYHPAERLDQGFFVTMFIPHAILSICIGKKKGVFAITAMINAFISVYMVTLVRNSFMYRFPNLATEYIVYIIFLPTILVFLKFFYVNLQTLIEKSLPKLIYIIILLSFVLCCEIVLYGIMINDESSNMLRLDIFGVAIISVYIISVASFYILMNEYDKTLTEAKDQEVLEANIQGVLTKLRVRKIKEEQLRLLRHDMKHVLISVASLIQSDKNDKALELINTYTPIVEATADKLYCKDPVINSVLDYYVAACKLNNIKIDVKINNIEDALNISAPEMSIFLSNCFDNAINACKKLNEDRRYISFKFINNDERLVLQLKNTFDGNLKIDANGLPTSTEDGHGIGTRSIDRFVKRHKCILNYEIKDKIFIINVLFSK